VISRGRYEPPRKLLEEMFTIHNGNKLEILKIKINNINLKALYDSGASVSAISSHVYLKHFRNKKLIPVNTQISSVDNTLINTMGKTSLGLKIGLNDKEKYENTEFYVVDFTNKKFDVILGITEIRKFKITFDENFELAFIDKRENMIDNKEDPRDRSEKESYHGINNMKMGKVQHSEEIATENPRVKKILNDYIDVFSTDVSDLKEGSTLTAPRQDYRFEVPSFRTQYPIPWDMQDKLKDYVKILEQTGIIEKSQSSFNSPILAFLKKSGEIRLTLDLRNINKHTVYMDYPMRNIKESLTAVSGSKVFSLLDLNSGFFQIQLPAEDRKYYSFKLPFGKYQFKRLSQGAKNSPQIFQATINTVFDEYLSDFVECFQDDILIYSKTMEEHLEHLKLVFERLRKYNLKIKTQKCVFGVSKFRFLGHEVCSKGIRPLETNIEAILKAKAPTSTKGVRSFLGSINFFRKFLPNCAIKMEPLQGLLKKGKKFKWNEECQKSFETLKEMLTTYPLLIHPNPGKPFILHSDASDRSIGGYLSQRVNDSEKPISYYSRNLNETEQRYSTIERELLAVIECLRHFRYYIYGRKVKILTDHKPLTYDSVQKFRSKRMLRWIEEIQDYSPTFEYVKGENNTVADFLSRQNFESKNQKVSESCNNINVNTNPSYVELLNKEKWKKFIKQIEKSKNGTFQNGKILYKINSKSQLTRTIRKGNTQMTQIIIPEGHVTEVLELNHSSKLAGHLGSEKTRRRIMQDYYWTGMSKDIENYILNCDKCQFYKDNIRKAPISPHYIPKQPFELVSLDLIGPLNATSANNRYILVIMDHLTRYPFIMAIPEISSQTIANSLIDNVISQYGIPKLLLSDRGSNFTSNLFKSISDILGIKKIETTSFRPQCNGALERLNQTVINIIRTQGADDWDKCLPFVAYTIRTASHSTSKFTPAELMFGIKPNAIKPMSLQTAPNNLEIITEIPEEEIEDYAQRMKAKFEQIRNSTIKEYTKVNQLRSDKMKTATIREFKPGDLVLLKKNVKIKGRYKFDTRFEGPYEVIKKLSQVNYQIKKKKGNKTMDVVHIDRIKKYHSNEIDNDNDIPCSEDEGEIIDDKNLEDENFEIVIFPNNEPSEITEKLPNTYTRSGREVRAPKRLIEEI